MGVSRPGAVALDHRRSNLCGEKLARLGKCKPGNSGRQRSPEKSG